MRIKKSHESGSLMVEVIAVLALLGVMGTMMFRQIQRRNEELDNINMASEIRMIKEATAAYIQANRAALETDTNFCNPGTIDATPPGVDVSELPLSDVEKFLPDNWISDEGTTNGIIHEYKIYLSCYRVNSPSADNRIAMYGTVVPNDPNDPSSDRSPLPPDFPLRRAARVAALIGADGGIHEKNESDFVGTMGAWQIDCADDGTCADRSDNFYVATTGMDIYVPETDKTADNTVAVPHDMAFQTLHATEYFSVGSGNANCVQNATLEGGGTYTFAHETLTESPTGINHAQSDIIRDPWAAGCEPLFWVGRDGNAGHVYVKNNLYVGRDENGRQAVAIETGPHNADRTLTVFNASGHGTVTLNGLGEIVGRVDAGQGYRLDAANGEIVLFREETANIGGTNRVVQIPTLRIRNGRMETDVNAKYHDGTTEQVAPYAVDPAGESLMNDIRLTSRGGARLSEILPNYILKGTQTITQTNDAATSVTKPTCPHGYAAAIMVTPIRYSQYVKNAELILNLTTNEGSNTAGHTHTAGGALNDVVQEANATSTTLIVNGSGDASGSELTLTQLPPVNISIDSGATWDVTLAYGTEPATDDDPITALAQTYCVYDDINRTATGFTPSAASSAIPETAAGLRIDSKDAAVITSSNRACTTSTECWSTETCVSGYCKPLGTCTNATGEETTHLGGKEWCIKGIRVYLECTTDGDCDSGKTCSSDNRCVDSGSGT